MNKIRVALALGISSAFLPACSDAGGEASDGSVAQAPASEQSLALGDSGARVRALHDYLMRFGYFENAELRARFPEWVPVVSETPENPEIFDEALQTAL